MKVTAKCTNHAGCLRAYRNDGIELEAGAPMVCPECGKPLTRLSGGVGNLIKVAAIVVGVLVLSVGGFIAVKLAKKGPETPTPTVDDIALKDSPDTHSSAVAKSDSIDQIGKPNPSTPTPSTPVPRTTPKETLATTAPDLPAEEPKRHNDPVTPEIRREVLTRIDQLPNVTPEKKDRLYNSVQRAKDMRLLVEISFGSGQSGMPANATQQVKQILNEPEVMKIRDEATAVFVVLGFADSKGDPKTSFEISEKRAKAVVEFMEKQCGVHNVTHAVAMGQTTLKDKKNDAKNRIAEIWAVLP